MTRKETFSDVDEQIIIPDGSWDDGLDLWGQTDYQGTPDLIVKSNPDYARYLGGHYKGCGGDRLHAPLLAHGIKLSMNFKTLVGFNVAIVGSCWPTKGCLDYCYGTSVRLTGGMTIKEIEKAVKKVVAGKGGLKNPGNVALDVPIINDLPNVVKAQIGNLAAIRRLAGDKKERESVADAIVDVVRAMGQDNIRWHGVGDLVPETVTFLDTLTARHPNFRVWGFTRRPAEAQKLPVRDNLVFWLSCDETSAPRLAQLRKAADRLGTGLAYTSLYGTKTTTFSPKKPRKNLKGVKGRPLTPLVKKRRWQDDALLPRVIDDCATIFGFHSQNMLTHVGVPNECPGTDPEAGGHYQGACQDCAWCQTRHDPGETLKRHRLEVDMDHAMHFRTWHGHG